jgi:lipoprotein-anchoring transpeptidase ErfK/SrfK
MNIAREVKNQYFLKNIIGEISNGRERHIQIQGTQIHRSRLKITTQHAKPYAIHGTNRPGSVGGFVSYGCIRMLNADISDLYERVSVGTPVMVTR